MFGGEIVKLGERIRARISHRYPKIGQPQGEVMIADGVKWRKVKAPKAWRPTIAGEVLVGELLGRSTRTSHGDSYGVVVLNTDKGKQIVSGVVITSLFDAAMLPDGAMVRIVYRGNVDSLAGRTYRDFDLYVAELPEGET